jgi:tetratricopeptide (TPR) repeat protein
VPSRLKFNSIISLLTCITLSSVTLPVRGQALLPYTPKLDSESLEQQGLALLQDAIQLIKFQQYQLALPRAELAAQLAPNNYEAWFILGSLYVQQQKLDQGIEMLEKAEGMAPDQEGILFTLGNAYFQKGEYQAALKKLEAGLKINNEAPEALFDLGNTYLKLTQYSEAIASYQKAFAQEEKFWPAINNVGLIKYEQGQIDEAIDNWNIAVAFFKQGQVEKGMELGEAALSLDGRYGEIEFLIENLWGERLIADTKDFFATPQMQAVVARSQQSSVEVETTP